ncbi:hypothetical protein KCU71_g9251, partial [Aureobasidium melanogenum]
MDQSMLGWKADDFFVAIKQQLDSLGPDSLHEACQSFQRMMEAASQKLSLVDVDLSHQALRADVITAVHQMVDNVTLATWTISNALFVIMCILLFVTLMVTLAVSMIHIMRNLDKCANKVSASLQIVSSELTSQGVLNHQRLFAEAVYNFIALQHMQQCMHPDEYPLEAKPNEAQYVIFHPSNDWHPSFFAYGTGKWNGDFMDEGNDHIVKKVHLSSSSQKLAKHLNDYANARVTEKPQVLPLINFGM